MADSFSTAFEESYSAVRRLQQNEADKSRIPSLNERMQMTHDIFKLDSIELAGLLSMIEKSNPSALSRRPDRDEALINIDAIEPTIFHELNSYILSCLVLRAGGKKKRASENGPGKDKSNKKMKT